MTEPTPQALALEEHLNAARFGKNSDGLGTVCSCGLRFPDRGYAYLNHVADAVVKAAYPPETGDGT